MLSLIYTVKNGITLQRSDEKVMLTTSHNRGIATLSISCPLYWNTISL